MADPPSKNTHGLAADRVELGLAPGSGFSKAKLMQNLDDELDAPDWANTVSLQLNFNRVADSRPESLPGASSVHGNLQPAMTADKCRQFS